MVAAFRQLHMNVTQPAIILLIAGRVRQGIVVAASFGGFGECARHVIGAVEGAASGRIGNFSLRQIAGIQVRAVGIRHHPHARPHGARLRAHMGHAIPRTSTG